MAITTAVWTDTDYDRQGYQDPAERLRIVIAAAIRAARCVDRNNDQLNFTITRVPRDGTSRAGAHAELIVYVGPGDDADPVATVMMSSEAELQRTRPTGAKPRWAVSRRLKNFPSRIKCDHGRYRPTLTLRDVWEGVAMSTIDQSWWTSASHDGQPLPEILAAHEFGKVFAFLRSRGWSVGAISTRTGIEEFRIREYIKGDRRIEKHRLIERIAEGLEIDPRLCRVGDLSANDTLPERETNSATTELQDLLMQANSLGESGLDLLADQTNQIRRIDRGFGAQASDLQLRGHLDTLWTLRSFSLLPAHRERLADLFCDAAALAGWVALDLGDVTGAWKHHESAKDAGRETGSVIALTHALAQQAYVLLDIGSIPQAVQLSQYALSLVDRTVPPVLLSWLHAVVGEMQAIVGQETLSKQAFEQAARLLPEDPTDPSVPYIMLDQFHLARWQGAAFARLGDEAAIDQMYFALSGMDQSIIRAKAQLHVDLAYSLVAARHEDQAVKQLSQAKVLATKVGSRRQKQRAKDMESSLNQPR